MKMLKLFIIFMIWGTLAYSATKPAGFNVLTGEDITTVKPLEGGRRPEVMAAVAAMKKEKVMPAGALAGSSN